MIKQLGDDQVKFKLALSLHAANDQKRHEIMPINDTNNIKALIEALNHFYKTTGNEITFNTSCSGILMIHCRMLMN